MQNKHNNAYICGDVYRNLDFICVIENCITNFLNFRESNYPRTCITNKQKKVIFYKFILHRFNYFKRKNLKEPYLWRRMK